MEATYIKRKKDGRIHIKSGNKGDQVVRWTLIHSDNFDHCCLSIF